MSPAPVTQPLLTDRSLQESFTRDGFVVVPLLGSRELARLRELYQTQAAAEKPVRPVHYTIDHPDRGHVRKVMSALIALLGDPVRRFLADPQVIAASFVVKEPHIESATPLHQDWTFVDEARWRSASVWVPLEDVDRENGALGVIHGSHGFFGARPRCSPAPHCESMIDRHGFALFPWMDVLPLNAGEALMFDNALIHGAPPNLTGCARVAAGISVAPAAAQLRHSYLVPGTQPPEIATYAVDWRFFASYGNEALARLFVAGRSPEGAQLLGREPHSFEPISRDALFELVRRDPRNREDPELARRLAPLAARYGIAL